MILGLITSAFWKYKKNSLYVRILSYGFGDEITRQCWGAVSICPEAFHAPNVRHFSKRKTLRVAKVCEKHYLIKESVMQTKCSYSYGFNLGNNKQISWSAVVPSKKELFILG